MIFLDSIHYLIVIIGTNKSVAVNMSIVLFYFLFMIGILVVLYYYMEDFSSMKRML